MKIASFVKIAQVEIFEAAYPNAPNWHPVLSRISTDEGISGAGGAGMVKNLAERFLIGADPFRIGELWDAMLPVRLISIRPPQTPGYSISAHWPGVRTTFWLVRLM